MYRLASCLAVLALCFGVLTSIAQAAPGVAVGREATVRSAGGLNVRGDASDGASVVAVADDGDFVNVLGGPLTDGAVEWYRVEYSGTVGWVAGSFLGAPRARGAPSARGGRRGLVEDGRVVLPVPYRSQYDGTAYSAGNCGPVSLAMALGAFGASVAVTDIRRAANKVQGTTGWYDSGVAITVLADLASEYGLTVRGLRANGGYDRWSFDEVRQALRNGNLVIPQVHYASLPGHERGNRAIDHFVVITGYEGDFFRYNDPAFSGGAGHGLLISQERLSLAWKRGDFPYAAFSVGPGAGMASLIAPPEPEPEVEPAPAVVPAPRPIVPAAVPPQLAPAPGGLDAAWPREAVPSGATSTRLRPSQRPTAQPTPVLVPRRPSFEEDFVARAVEWVPSPTYDGGAPPTVVELADSQSQSAREGWVSLGVALALAGLATRRQLAQLGFGRPRRWLALSTRRRLLPAPSSA